MKLRRVKQMARALREAHPGTSIAYWLGSLKEQVAREGLMAARQEVREVVQFSERGRWPTGGWR